MERFRGGVRGETQQGHGRAVRCLVNYVPRFSDEMTVRS
jgi:hypothetical protein